MRYPVSATPRGLASPTMADAAPAAAPAEGALVETSPAAVTTMRTLASTIARQGGIDLRAQQQAALGRRRRHQRVPGRYRPGASCG